MVQNLKARYQWCFRRLKCKKIDPADAITSEAVTNGTNKVFRRKQIPNKESPKIFRDLEVRKMVGLMLWSPQYSIKVECYIFSGYQQRNKVGLVHLEWKWHQDRYGWCIFKLKLKKPVDRT